MVSVAQVIELQRCQVATGQSPADLFWSLSVLLLLQLLLLQQTLFAHVLLDQYPTTEHSLLKGLPLLLQCMP